MRRWRDQVDSPVGARAVFARVVAGMIGTFCAAVFAAVLGAAPATAVAAPIPVAALAAGADPATPRLLVLQKHAEILSGYDPETGDRAGGGVRVFAVPHEMAPTADGRELFITNYGVKTFLDTDAGANTVTVVNAARLEHAGVVDLGANHRPHGIVRGRSGRFYVTTDFPAAVLIIDPTHRAVVARIALDQKLPHMVAVTADEARVAVANAGSGTVTIVPLAGAPVDPAAPAVFAPKLRTVVVGGTPMGLVFSADGRWLYASNRDANQIAVIDVRSGRVARDIAIRGQPTRLALDPRGHLLLASTIEGGAVVVVDVKTSKEVARIPVGHRPEGLLVDWEHGRGFVSVQDDDKVVAFSLGDWKVLREIKTGSHPDALWLDRSSHAETASGAERPEGNPTRFLTPERLAARPGRERELWARYLETSTKLDAADRALIGAELGATGRPRMTPAPYSRAFDIDPARPVEWFRGDDGRHIVANVLSFQTPAGGWSKHVDMTQRPRRPGESFYSENDGWSYIATIDNDSTTDELRFLAAAFAATADPTVAAAFVKGISYLMTAQYPNGCWPQVYPLKGGYHDAITFNDNAIVNVMRLLGEVADGRFGFVAADVRKRAAAAGEQGLACILATQVVERGRRTVWAQQHDPLGFEPVAARSYELAGLAGRESAVVVAYLMSLHTPPPAVVAAVDAAVAWFRANQISGYEYDVKTGLRKVDGAGPIWARLTEPETGKPIFSNRDGVKRYDWNELSDRRFGYTWFTKEPAAVLSTFQIWTVRHAQATAATSLVR